MLTNRACFIVGPGVGVCPFKTGLHLVAVGVLVALVPCLGAMSRANSVGNEGVINNPTAVDLYSLFIDPARVTHVKPKAL